MSLRPFASGREALTRHGRIVREGLWVVAGQAATAAGLLIGIRVLTELLTPAVFGRVALLMGIWSLARSLFVVSVGNAALRFYPEFARSGKVGTLRRAASGLMLRCVAAPAAVIVLVGALYALSGALADPRTLAGSDRPAFLAFVMLAAYLSVDAARAYETNYLVAARRQKAAALLEGADAFARPALAVPAVLLLGAAPHAVFLAYAVASACVLLVIHLFLRRDGVPTPEGPLESEIPLRRELFRYALPLMPKAVVVWVSGQSDRYIIGLLRGPDQVGLYSTAYGLVSQPFLMAQESLSRTLTPSYFLAVADGDRKAESRIFRMLLWGTVLLCGTGVLLVLLLHDQIARLLLAERFRSGAPLMTWIALGNAILGVEYVFEKHLFAHKRTADLLWIQSVGAVASVVATVPLVSLYGARGAAIACPIYYAAQLLFAIWRTRR